MSLFAPYVHLIPVFFFPIPPPLLESCSQPFGEVQSLLLLQFAVFNL